MSKQTNSNQTTFENVITAIKKIHNIDISIEDILELDLKHISLNQKQLVDFIVLTPDKSLLNSNQIVKKVLSDYNSKISLEEIEFLRNQFYKKPRKFINYENNKFEYYYDNDFLQLLLEKKIDLITSHEIREKLIGSLLPYIPSSEEIDSIFREKFEKKFLVVTRQYTRGKNGLSEYYYGPLFLKFLKEEISEGKSTHNVFESSIIPNLDLKFPKVIFDEHAKKGAKLILRAKALDSSKGGRTVETIGSDIRELQKAYYEDRENYINKFEIYNLSKEVLPIPFYKKRELIRMLKQNDGRYLSYSELSKITKGWFDAHHKIMPTSKNITFYYNHTFYLHLARYLRFKNYSINNNGNEIINYYVSAPNRPLIYTKKNNKIKLSTKKQMKLDSLKSSWIDYQNNYDLRLKQLLQEEDQSDRGDWLLGEQQDMFEETGYNIFYRTSRYFDSIFKMLYRLTDEFSGSFSTPETRIQAIYDNYYDKIFKDRNREISYEEFIRIIKQEYIYISNGFRNIRLDFFREIEPAKKESTGDFTGGLLHGLNHFEGFAYNKNDNNLFISAEFFKNLRSVIFTGTIIKSKLDNKTGNFTLELQKECKISNYDTKLINKQIIKKIQNCKAVMYYDVAKELYYLTTFHYV